MEESKDVLPIYDDAYRAFVTKYPDATAVNAHAYARMVVELSHADVTHQEIKEKLHKISYSVLYLS